MKNAECRMKDKEARLCALGILFCILHSSFCIPFSLDLSTLDVSATGQAVDVDQAVVLDGIPERALGCLRRQRQGLERGSNLAIQEIEQFGVRVSAELRPEFWRDAARIKVRFTHLSLADAICIALARRLDARLIAADSGFRPVAVGHSSSIRRIPGAPSLRRTIAPTIPPSRFSLLCFRFRFYCIRPEVM